MSRLAVYESKAVSVIFGGLDLTDGRGEDFFSISSNGPAYITEGPGADGHVARCGTNNDLYEITLTLKGTSEEHAKLSAIHIADRAATTGAGVAPLFIKDANGSTLIATDRCWIVGMPEQTFGVTKGDVEWVFNAIIEAGGFILGGN
jgi:hypothetical protein